MRWLEFVASSVVCAGLVFLVGGCARQLEPSVRQNPSAQQELTAKQTSSAEPQACIEFPGLAALARDRSNLRAWSIAGRGDSYVDVIGSCYGLPRDRGYRSIDCDRLLKFHNLLEPAEENERREIRAELLANKCDFYIGRSSWRAEETCEEAVESSPTNPLALYARGRFHMAAENWQAAIEDFSVAIDGRPCFPSLFLHRAYAAMHRGRFSDAKTDLDVILAENPGLVAVRTFRELLRYRQGDRERALLGLEWINAVYPDYDGAHVLRAQLLAGEGRFGAAIAAIDEAIRRDSLPRSAKWRAIRGQIRLAMGDPAKAVTDFEQAVAIDNDKDEYNFGLATALACSGQLAEAIPAFNLAKNRARIGNPSYYYADWLARAWILATASDDVLRDGNAALKEVTGFRAPIWKGVGPSYRLYSDAIEVEAASRAEIGEFRKAVELQRKAIDSALQNGKPDGTISEMRARLGLYASGRSYRSDAYCPDPPPEDPYRWLLDAPWHTERKINPFESVLAGPIL